MSVRMALPDFFGFTGRHIANIDIEKLRSPCPKSGRELLKFGGRNRLRQVVVAAERNGHFSALAFRGIDARPHSFRLTFSRVIRRFGGNRTFVRDSASFAFELPQFSLVRFSCLT